MKRAFKQQIVGLLDEHRIMTIATNRADGWPQATVVGYANDGLLIYCFVARDGQKFANIARDPRVSIAIANDYPQPLQIKGLSLAARAVVVATKARSITRAHPAAALSRIQGHAAPGPGRRADAADHAGDRFDPRLRQGLRSHRSRARDRERSRRISKRGVIMGELSRGLTRSRQPRPGDRRAAQEFLRLHRLLPARCNSTMRTAPSPQAMVSWSSSTVPGAPLPSPGRAQHLHPLAAKLAPGAGKRRQPADMVVHLLPRLRPVDARLGLVDLRRVGDAVGGLRRELQRAALQRASARAIRSAPSRASASCNSPAVMSGPIGMRSTHRHRAGVEPLVHLHHRDAGLGVARHDRAVDRRGAAPARQQRGVQVEAAERRRVEDRLRQDQAVGDDDRGIGLVRGECGLRLRRSCSDAGVSTGRPSRRASRSTGDRHQLQAAAAAGLRRARIDRRDVVARRRPARAASAPRSPACP